MLRTIVVVASLALFMAACASNSEPPLNQQDGGGADRLAQHDGQQDAPVQEDGPVQHDGASDSPVEDDGGPQDGGQQDAGPATLFADIRYLQQDPSLTGLAPLNSRVRIEGAVVTAVKTGVNRFFIQNASGPKEYSGILVKRSSACPTDLAVGDVLSAIEGTLVEESVYCNIDASVCPTRHSISTVTLCTRGSTGATVPTPLDVTGATLLATTAKYDGLLVHLSDGTLTVGTQPDGGTATTTPLSDNLFAYGLFYSPPGIVPSGTTVTTCIGAIDLYNQQWEVDPRTNADFVLQDWPPDAGIQSDAGQSDGSGQADASSTSDSAPCSTGDVVISQVYGGGGNAGPPAAPYKNDFVELFNRSNAAVDVGAWSVQYASYNGTSWTAVALTGKTIPAGGYLLVQFGGGSTGVALPTADVTNSTNLSATHGKIALVNNATALTTTCPLPSANVVDFVGYGTDPTCSETSKAPAGANDQSVIRKSAGCQDYNDNGYDFAAGAPNPRNSATTAAPCGC